MKMSEKSYNYDGILPWKLDPNDCYRGYSDTESMDGIDKCGKKVTSKHTMYNSYEHYEENAFYQNLSSTNGENEILINEEEWKSSPSDSLREKECDERRRSSVDTTTDLSCENIHVIPTEYPKESEMCTTDDNSSSLRNMQNASQFNNSGMNKHKADEESGRMISFSSSSQVDENPERDDLYDNNETESAVVTFEKYNHKCNRLDNATDSALVTIEKYNHKRTKLDEISFRSKGSQEGEKPKYMCEICKNFFSTPTTLSRHRMIHTGERPFKCELCEKAFKTNYELKYHKFMHTSDNPLECEICGKLFTTPRSLERHWKIHTGDLPFKCELCEKCCKTSYDLNYHKLSHASEKPYKCNVCTKSFAIPSKLKRHLMIHTGEKPYTCEFCGKCCRTKGNLKCHLQVHSGEKPYKCDECGKRFVVQRSLRLHQNTHTRSGDKP